MASKAGKTGEEAEMKNLPRPILLMGDRKRAKFPIWHADKVTSGENAEIREEEGMACLKILQPFRIN